MPGLADHKCYQVCKPIDLEPALSLLGRLPFFAINGHVTPPDPNKPQCSVSLSDKWPPEFHAWIAALGLGGTLGRAVLRKLSPGQHIPVHTDAWMPGELNWRRFQVPLVSHPDIVMRWPDDGVELYLAPGFLYEVRYDRPHEVIHGAQVDRVHLQLDAIDATI